MRSHAKKISPAEFELIVRRLREEPDIAVVISPLDALTIVSQIQLALQHPKNAGPAAQSSRDAVREFIEQVVERLDVVPGFREFIEMGFDPRYDTRV